MDILRRSRRSKSFSFHDTIPDEPSATADTISTRLHYLSIPFSWEKVPGIPKANTNNKTNNHSHNLLPLPPSGNFVHQSPPLKKYNSSRSFVNDPFLAAFVECSKDKEFMNIEGVGKSSKRSGFVVSMYSSCKRTCAVSESIVFRPRSSRGYVLATDEDLIVAKRKP